VKLLRLWRSISTRSFDRGSDYACRVELACKRHGEARQAWRGSAGLGSARSGAAGQASLAACAIIGGMSDKLTISEKLEAIAAELRRAERVDWVDDPNEVLTVAEAAHIAGRSDETIRRWCGEYKIGRLFASSLWLVSRRRLLQHIERRFGRPAMVLALSRGQMQHRSLSAPHFSIGMPVGATKAG